MTFSESRNAFKADMSFASSPIHHQRMYAGQTALNASPCHRSKRRNSDSSYNVKKVKEKTVYDSPSPSPLQGLSLETIDLSEYPQFHHPDGGIIQFTPIGNVRSIVNPQTNQVERAIETSSKFNLNDVDRGIDGYKIFLGKDCSGAGCSHADCSSTNEAESYMRNGYASFYSNPAGCYGGDYDCDSDFDEDDCDVQMH